jgi:hypothetical protein
MGVRERRSAAAMVPGDFAGARGDHSCTAPGASAKDSAFLALGISLKTGFLA